MRLTHIAATVLLASLLGCDANAQLVATAGASASPSPAAPSPTASPDAFCTGSFDRYDVDKDTFLSADEFVAGKWGDLRFIKAPTAQEEADAKARFRADAGKADADKDGKLSRTEFLATCT